LLTIDNDAPLPLDAGVRRKLASRRSKCTREDVPQDVEDVMRMTLASFMFENGLPMVKPVEREDDSEHHLAM
jgi:hypothetical protein